MANKRKRILLPYGATKEIAKAMDCSAQTVRHALYGVTKSEKANKIRHMAQYEFGGSMAK